MSAWKANLISLAGRLTLINSVIFALPNYTMQTAVLPLSTCDEIDKKCRSFLWGELVGRCKIHLVDWKTVCSTKDIGGLDLRHCRTMNSAFMMKAGSGLIQKPDALWVKVLRSKYKCGEDIVPLVHRKQSDSNLWKGICSRWRKIKDHMVWRVGEGSEIKLWLHPWVPNIGSLEQYTILLVDEVDESSTL